MYCLRVGCHLYRSKAEQIQYDYIFFLKNILWLERQNHREKDLPPLVYSLSVFIWISHMDAEFQAHGCWHVLMTKSSSYYVNSDSVHCFYESNNYTFLFTVNDMAWISLVTFHTIEFAKFSHFWIPAQNKKKLQKFKYSKIINFVAFEIWL